jgi:hypothetical protein
MSTIHSNLHRADIWWFTARFSIVIVPRDRRFIFDPLRLPLGFGTMIANLGPLRSSLHFAALNWHVASPD